MFSAWRKPLVGMALVSSLLKCQINRQSLRLKRRRTMLRILNRRGYYEISTLEGRLETIDVHGKKKVFGIYDVITNHKILCHFDKSILPAVVAALSQRVSVEGMVKFDRSGTPLSINVDNFEVMPGMDELPQFDEGQGINITSGISSEDYVRGLRDAE